MTQMTLTFEDRREGYPYTPAHTEDDTSTEAAKAIEPMAETIRCEVLSLIRHEPVTVHECAKALGRPVSTVQPRFSELRKMGFVEDGGDRRTNSCSGKRAIVWQPVSDVMA